jgi:predicted peptidase
MQPHVLKLDAKIHKRVILPYLLWLPHGYPAAKRWPLILFLHGRGERGTDLEGVRREGLGRRLTEGFTVPAIVVAPQCPPDSDWTLQDDALLALLDEIEATHPVAPDRVYLTGLSMGARETWRLAAQYASRFAAIVPICGRRPDGVRNRADAVTLAHMPTWVFHGAKDTIVPVEESEAMVAALRSYGADVHYTIYPEAGHDSWTQAYAEAELFPWLLSQRRTT